LWSGAGYPDFGCATYRLTVLLPNAKNLMIHISEVTSASSVWINGTRVYDAGRVALTGGHGTGEIPAKANALLSLPVMPSGADGAVEIVVQTSNHERPNASGLCYNFHVGSDAALTRFLFTRLAILTGIVGAFAAIGLYHAMLYFFQRGPKGEIIYLIFSALCLVTGMRFLVEPNSLMALLLPVGAELWIPVSRFLLRIHLILIVMFSLAAFGIRLGKIMKFVYAAMFVLVMAAYFTFSTALSYKTALLLNIPNLVTLVLAGRTLSVKLLRERPWSGLYFAALVFFIVWAPLANLVLGHRFFVPVLVSNIFIMLVQCFVLSRDYADVRRRAEELAAKTDFYHRLSHDLLTPLTVVSTNVQVANMYPETDHERLVKSQAEIMKMAAMINRALMGDRGAEDGDG
jgi:hypothetical protein